MKEEKRKRKKIRVAHLKNNGDRPKDSSCAVGGNDFLVNQGVL